MLAFTRTLINILFFLGIAAFCVSFALSNKQAADITLPWSDLIITAPLFMFVIGALVLGGLLGSLLLWILTFPKHHRLRRAEKKHARTVSAQQQEIEALRLEAHLGQPYADPR